MMMIKEVPHISEDDDHPTNPNLSAKEILSWSYEDPAVLDNPALPFILIEDASTYKRILKNASGCYIMSILRDKQHIFVYILNELVFECIKYGHEFLEFQRKIMTVSYLHIYRFLITVLRLCHDLSEIEAINKLSVIIKNKYYEVCERK